MKRLTGIIALGVAVSPMIADAAPLTTQQFNLECIGTEEVLSSGHEKRVGPYRIVYSVDLTAGQYCEADCRVLNHISAVQPAFIELYKKEADTPSEKTSSSSTIDRITGEHASIYNSETRGRYGSYYLATKHGKCERQPFTGFPTFETKF